MSLFDMDACIHTFIVTEEETTENRASELQYTTTEINNNSIIKQSMYYH